MTKPIDQQLGCLQEISMALDPLVSIITPTYNHENFISECLESVLAQSYASWEQIVIDDGSTDKTAKIVSQFKDDRIKYIRQDNKGILRLGESYNLALQISKGEYIAVLEGDDFWPSDKLEIQIDAMRGSDAVLSWGRAEVMDEKGDLLAVLPNDMERFMGLSREEQLGNLLIENPMHSCTIVCKKVALQSIGGFKQPQGLPFVDGSTWLELSLIGDFLPIDAVLGCYRRHDRQISSTMKSSMVRAGLYFTEFFKNLPADVKASLANEDTDIAARMDRKAREIDYYLGRAYLREGKWSDARESLLKAIKEENLPSIKAKAILGILCGLLRTDLEWLAAFIDPREGRR